MLLRSVRVRGAPVHGLRALKYGMLVETRGHVEYDHVKACGFSTVKPDQDRSPNMFFFSFSFSAKDGGWCCLGRSQRCVKSGVFGRG